MTASNPGRAPADRHLQVRQLACSRGDRQLFSGVDFELQPGEALWVTGPNGSGKTSLLRLLCGLSLPESGAVHWDGQDIFKVRDDFHRELCHVGHASAVKDDLTAWENVAVSTRLAGRACSQDDALQALDQVGLLAAARLPARALSQGQRKRVALARLCVRPAPTLSILDEPFNALDQAAITQVCGTLNQHLADGGIVVYTTHQPQALQARRTHHLDLNQARPC
ncbi:MAG: cytochrome c biogenesis heme-transporting ATPase CcmA [Rubrivivax sp.]|nr:MAG: cytochrome c biogenesis heme-transporting ATPase CcmA [Rubrivivax sp.]